MEQDGPVTDISDYAEFLPNRLGASGWTGPDGELVIGVEPVPATCRLGVVRVSVLSFVVDAAAGIVVDADPDSWTMTSQLSVRMPATPGTSRIEARVTTLRDSRRSATGEVHLVDPDRDAYAGYGIASFLRVPRREGDATKFVLTPEHYGLLGGGAPLDRPLPEEAGIRVLDAPTGHVEIDVTERLRNPAGTLQGALVALVAEVAAEEYLTTVTGAPVVVTELDVRYLAQAREGTVRSRLTPLGPGADAPVVVELLDAATDRLLTHVVARGVSPSGQ